MAVFSPVALPRSELSSSPADTRGRAAAGTMDQDWTARRRTIHRLSTDADPIDATGLPISEKGAFSESKER